mmetsp:Transcript_34547/g.92624  ORF Transcript_34547/g.92624 Transcript_34547/m.92624 type:complete len:246 (-) Transcript_34547:23-760(-)
MMPPLPFPLGHSPSRRRGGGDEAAEPLHQRIWRLQGGEGLRDALEGLLALAGQLDALAAAALQRLHVLPEARLVELLEVLPQLPVLPGDLQVAPLGELRLPQRVLRLVQRRGVRLAGGAERVQLLPQALRVLARRRGGVLCLAAKPLLELADAVLLLFQLLPGLSRLSRRAPLVARGVAHLLAQLAAAAVLAAQLGLELGDLLPQPLRLRAVSPLVTPAGQLGLEPLVFRLLLRDHALQALDDLP